MSHALPDGQGPHRLGVGVSGTGQPENTHIPAISSYTLKWVGGGSWQVLCCQKVLLAPLMGPDYTQHPGRLRTRAERNQGGVNECILECVCVGGWGWEVERVGGGRQCELGGLLFAVLVLATFRRHPVFLSAYHSFPSFWRHHSGFPLRDCPASSPSPWHPGRMTLPSQSQIQKWAQAPVQAIVLSMACFRDGLTWKLGPSVSALGL